MLWGGGQGHNKKTQIQLTWAHKASKRLTHQPGSLLETDLGPPHVTIVYLGLPVGLLTVRAGAVSDFCYLLLRPFPPTGLPHLALIAEEVPSLTAT